MIVISKGWLRAETGSREPVSTWTQLAPAGHPSGRRYHTMVYAEGADKMVLFGGMAGNFLKEEKSDELWIFDPVAEDWSQVLPSPQ